VRLEDSALAEVGRRVLQLEACQVSAAATRLDGAFVRAVRLLAAARGRVIVSGVGKSGLIARKIAATLTSTGTAASYLHPIDSLHGDLGIVGKDDIAIILSKSGSSEDLFGLVGSLQRLRVPIIAITGGADSALARVATVTLDASVTEEACPHDLVPTASTTVALALGDALAVALLDEKGISREQFAELHPGGSLGGGCCFGFATSCCHREGSAPQRAPCEKQSSVWRTTGDWPWCRTMDISRGCSRRVTSPAWRSGIRSFLNGGWTR
jgi:arabinose-5-phosphate isomerase